AFSFDIIFFEQDLSGQKDAVIRVFTRHFALFVRLRGGHATRLAQLRTRTKAEERIIIEAKRELYLTNKAIKEIAYELGDDEEYYFSRFFKINAEISPQMYRDTVGFGRGVD